MTLFVEFPESTATADGSSATFNVGFTFESNDQLVVSVQHGAATPVVKTLGTHYLVTGDPATAAQLVFQSGFVPLAGDIVLCRRVTPAEQPDAYGDLAGFRPSLVAKALDRITRMVQEDRRDMAEGGDGGGGGAMSGVASVNGRQGAVSLTAADVALGFGAAVGANLFAGAGISLTKVGNSTTINNTAMGGGGGGAVNSVNTRAGDVTLTAADVATGFPAAVNATLAAGAGISLGFASGVTTITNTGAGAVTSVATRTGAVTLTAADVSSGFGAAVGAALAAGTNVSLSTSSGITTINATLAGGAICTFNSADTDSHVALSGGNLVASLAAGFGSRAESRATLSRATGKFYLEYRASSTAVFGALGSAAAALTGAATILPGGNAATPDGFTIEPDGTILANNVIALSGGWCAIQSSGAYMQVAVDLDAKKVWIKPVSGTGSTTWNNSGSADPATGVGGISYASAAANLFPMASLNATGDTLTANFGAASFAGSIPSGFAAWAPGSLGGAAVNSVNGRTGNVTLAASDVASGFDTAVFGALTAGSGISITHTGGTVTITNTAGGGGGGGVTSVNTRTGAVSLTAADVSSGFGAAVGAALAAGSGVGLSTVGGITTITASGSLAHSYTPAYENGVRVANSAATNTANLNALIASLVALGGGTIWFNEPGAYQIDGTILLRSYVSLKMTSGARFAWTGSASGVIVSSPTNEVLLHTQQDISIDEGGSFTGQAFSLHSAQFNTFKVTGWGSSTGGIFAHIQADSTAGQQSFGGRNTVFNEFRLQHRRVCGTFLLIEGDPTPGFGGQEQAVTLNTFYNSQANGAVSYGIRLDQWCDTNTFAGNTYIGLIGAGGVGLFVNAISSPVPSVYNIHLGPLSIDTFGSGLGRYGVVLGLSECIYCDAYFNDPPAENGSFTGAACVSYEFRMKQDGTNNIFKHQKNILTGL